MSNHEQTAHLFGAIQCAPVLAGIKPSNLLQVARRIGPATVRGFLADTGLTCEYLYASGDKHVWLVYREEELQELLDDPERREFLAGFGYRKFTMAAVLQLLRRHLAAYQRGGTYPHEIGILLGYPLADVRGFVEQGGKNFLCSGYWKVYGDVAEARRCFDSFGRARSHAAAGIRSGMSFCELAQSFRLRRFAEAV